MVATLVRRRSVGSSDPSAAPTGAQGAIAVPHAAADVTMRVLYDAFFALHHGCLLRLLHGQVQPSEVEDLAIEIWIDVRRRLPGQVMSFAAMRGDELQTRSRAWVLAFGRLRALRWRRDRARRREDLGAVALTDVRDEGDGHDALLTRRSTAMAVHRALALIPDARERALLEEIYFADRSLADAARARGWDESRLRRALHSAESSMKRTLLRLRVAP